MGGCAGTPQSTQNPNVNQNNYAKPVATTNVGGVQQRPSPNTYQPQMQTNNTRPATASTMRDADNDIPKVLALESTRQIKRPRRNI